MLNYKSRVKKNLESIQNRLQKVLDIMKSYADTNEDSINFFEVFKDGKKVDDI